MRRLARASALVVAGIGAMLPTSANWESWVATMVAQAPAGAAAVAIDPDDIGGVVTGPSGPEAGVWVVAETTDLSTKLVKIVVTDDQGRYRLENVPPGSYNLVVWNEAAPEDKRRVAIPEQGGDVEVNVSLGRQ